MWHDSARISLSLSGIPRLADFLKVSRLRYWQRIHRLRMGSQRGQCSSGGGGGFGEVTVMQRVGAWLAEVTGFWTFGPGKPGSAKNSDDPACTSAAKLVA